MTLSDIRVCVHCGNSYELGFYGTGKKFCSEKCRRHRYKFIGREKRVYKKVDKDCQVCGRNILKVGLRKHANKYCSKKCMNLAQRIREGREFCTIKIPVKDLHLFFGQK